MTCAIWLTQGLIVTNGALRSLTLMHFLATWACADKSGSTQHPMHYHFLLMFDFEIQGIFKTMFHWTNFLCSYWILTVKFQLSTHFGALCVIEMMLESINQLSHWASSFSVNYIQFVTGETSAMILYCHSSLAESE